MRVCVRVRGQAEAGRSMLTTDGARGMSLGVTLDGAALSTTRAAARSRTYAFDRVFSAEADQNMVFSDTVGAMLDDVLLGYNCTIFAYGPTGTGKTHTMEGDLAPYMETFAPDAGVIPRTLYRLFHILDTRFSDFSVRLSMVELYNEELRDLLHDGASASALRMYDEARPHGRAGVMLHGLEEVALTSAEHGVRLLRQGSRLRHTASTRCNDRSSRSHCVFTLTVHVSDTGVRGEEMMRVGKLNLVDLAGSESVGRSGAEHARAREAGLINQSLLTLGRVIHALVDGSSHVPYRESRLTRLLQDSLGGRAKTCMIVTVSDDSGHAEETLSTLDYAYRAKAIKNRPEANARVTRAALVRDYVDEVDRLRRDLAAARAEHGVYLDEASWARHEAEHAALLQRADEQKRSADVAQSRMASLQEQLEQNTRVLAKREADAARWEAQYAARAHELDAAHARIAELTQSLAEETQLREAHAASEQRLHDVARELREHVAQAHDDTQRWHTRAERRAAAEAHTTQAHLRFGHALQEARARARDSAAVDARGALEAMLTRLEATHTHIQRSAAERLAQLGLLEAARLDEVEAALAHSLREPLAALRAAHASSAGALLDALETQATDMAALLAAAGDMAEAWDAHAASWHNDTQALVAQAQQGAALATAQAQQRATAAEQRAVAMHAAMAAWKDAVVRATDACHSELASHAEQETSRASEAEAAAAAWQARVADACPEDADARHDALARSAQHLVGAADAARRSAATPAEHLEAHMHAFDGAVASLEHEWQAQVPALLAPVQHTWTDASARWAAAQRDVAQLADALHALDVRALAKDAMDTAAASTAQHADAARRLDDLVGAFRPLAAPHGATGETPPRRAPTTLPTWDLVPRQRAEALAWWAAQHGGTPASSPARLEAAPARQAPRAPNALPSEPSPGSCPEAPRPPLQPRRERNVPCAEPAKPGSAASPPRRAKVGPAVSL